MIKKYFIGYMRTDIKEVEAEKETDKSLWFKRARFDKIELIRVLKSSSYENYFDTWKEAYNYLVNKYEKKVKSSKNSYEKNKSLLGQVRKLKN